MIINPYAFPSGGGGGGSPSLIASYGEYLGANGGTTTSGVDTTGSNLLVIGVAGWDFSDHTVSDNYSNTWTALSFVTSGYVSRIYYCANATVGSGHTFTVTRSGGYPVASIQAWSNMSSTPFDVENVTGGGGGGPPKNTGSVTPSQANSVAITALRSNGSGSVDSGFTITTSTLGAGMYGAIAYKIKTSASAENPQWTAAADMSCGIAVFKY